MAGEFENANVPKELPESSPAHTASSRSTKVLGFVGSAIICWIALKFLAPMLVSAWGIVWIGSSWAKIGITGIAALAMSALLSRIEGTIWGKYYVILGYLLSLVLVVWMVLRLLHYI